MFSGIIDHIGTIIGLEKKLNGLQLIIESQFNNLTAGESIAVDGICLTVVDPQEKYFACDLSPETLKLTTAHEFAIGRQVNLERALRLGDPVGGHMVSGHIDQQAFVKVTEWQHEFFLLTFSGIAKEDLIYLVKKGSIAINGASLTINAVLADGFQVMLIPHTLERTNLKYLTVGDAVNIEFDSSVKVIINYLTQLALVK